MAGTGISDAESAWETRSIGRSASILRCMGNMASVHFAFSSVGLCNEVRSGFPTGVEVGSSRCLAFESLHEPRSRTNQDVTRCAGAIR